MNVLLRARSVIISRRYCTATSSCSHYRKLNVQVGGSLQLNLAQVNADVDVYTVDNMEQIEIKSLWKDAGSVSAAFNAITQQNNCICVDLETSEAKQSLQKLEAFMPGRWCNLFLRSGEGHVTIQNMKEANMSVVTNCGSITLGEVRGNKALIESNGGNVKAASITAALELRTGGGNLSIEKAVGTKLQIESDGGDVRIGSAYGQDVDIRSGGGCISIKHLQAQEKAHVSSSGGHVQIDGLDGNVVISTNGGNLHVQLLANAKEVKINAGAGEVALFTPSEDHIKLHVEQVEDGDSHTENLVYPGEKHLLGQDLEENHPSCRVFNSGSGKVTTKRRSWLESVIQGLKHQRSMV